MADYAPCPKCGSTGAKKVGYTWWGGVLGPTLFSLVKCQSCQTTYNGKTGKSATTAIIVYFVVTLIICIVLYVIASQLGS